MSISHTRKDGKVYGNTAALLTGSDVMIPTEKQATYAKTVQTHNAVTVANATWNTQSSWQDAEGFDQIAVTLLSDNSASNSMILKWSHDGVAEQGEETVIVAGTGQRKASQTGVKARYFKVSVNNGHTAPVVMNAWAYLKA